MTLRETDYVSEHQAVAPRTAVLLWRGGEQVQFSTESQFFRWATDNLGQPFKHDVFWIDDVNRQVRRMTAVFDGERWLLVDEDPRPPLPIVDGRRIVYPDTFDVLALTTRRQREIATLLELGLAGGGLPVKLVQRRQWATDAGGRLFWTFGYAASDDAGVLACPAIIDEQTADLDDEHLDVYLAAVEQKLLYESGMELVGTVEDRAAAIDRIIAETSPSSHAVVHGVEAKVIDDQFRELLG